METYFMMFVARKELDLLIFISSKNLMIPLLSNVIAGQIQRSYEVQ